MIHNETIEGIAVKLRAVCEGDAEFILSLRTDPKISRFLNRVENDKKKQESWIRNQKEREGDYYFLIINHKEEPLGTISLYGIEERAGEFGRWISLGNAAENTESAILLYDFGFSILNLEMIYTRTAIENRQVVNFHKRFGATQKGIVPADSENRFHRQEAVIEKADYERIRERNFRYIELFCQ